MHSRTTHVVMSVLCVCVCMYMHTYIDQWNKSTGVKSEVKLLNRVDLVEVLICQIQRAEVISLLHFTEL